MLVINEDSTCDNCGCEGSLRYSIVKEFYKCLECKMSFSVKPKKIQVKSKVFGLHNHSLSEALGKLSSFNKEFVKDGFSTLITSNNYSNNYTLKVFRLESPQEIKDRMVKAEESENKKIEKRERELKLKAARAEQEKKKQEKYKKQKEMSLKKEEEKKRKINEEKMKLEKFFSTHGISLETVKEILIS
jgi:hypothetical protein